MEEGRVRLYGMIVSLDYGYNRGNNKMCSDFLCVVWK